MSTITPPSTRALAERWRPSGWLLVALAAAGLVAATYVATHAHPAYEGGLYLRFVEEIRANGYRLPTRVPGYTADGVPFAYPPLLFYAVAVVVDLWGVDPVGLMRVAPGVAVVAYLVPFYAVARELSTSRRRAGFATMLFAVTPPVLQWHLSAGGLVRAPSMLLTLTGVYAGIRLFRTGDRRWLAPAALLWGLTVLSHPVYAAFFAWSYLLLYAFLDRSFAGLANGVVVCAGGLLLAAPWWLSVAAAHGPGIFLAASDSRTSLGGGGWRLLTQFLYPVAAANGASPFYLAAFAGGVYAVARRRYLLPVWMASAAYLLGVYRFTFVAGSVLAADLVFEVVGPAVADVRLPGRRRTVALGVALLLAFGATGAGVAYASGALHTARGASPSQPQTVRATDLDAMAWAAEHTAPGADFLVLGDAAEWFPYYADRTILVSPWGTEWTSTSAFREHVELYTDASTCGSAACLEATYADLGRTPDYVYVPARVYTVRGERHDRPDRLVASLQASERYRLRFAGRGVLVFEVTRPTGQGPTAGSHVPGRGDA